MSLAAAMRLSDLSAGRDNNLNLLRLVAAATVMLIHSLALSTGSAKPPPLVSSLGMAPDAIAVDVFFLISGFLVANSILRSESLVDFSVARALRIFPGLLVMLALVVFGLGLAFTHLPWRDYLQSQQTYSYLAKCATLVRGVAYELPGVFENNPHRRAVNGSLWTLPYEVKMYALLAFGWWVCGMFKQLRTKAFAASCVAAMVLSGGVLAVTPTPTGQNGKFAWLFFMFFTGASFFVLRRYIRLTPWAALPLGALLVAAALVSKPAFVAVYLLGIAYLTFYIAYVPGGFIRRYNAVGDFSYGVYIYAFPLQQTVVALVPGISTPWLSVGSGAITLVLAMLSWFLIEKPALRWKGPLVQRLMGRLGYERHDGLWRRAPRGG